MDPVKMSPRSVPSTEWPASTSRRSSQTSGTYTATATTVPGTP